MATLKLLVQTLTVVCLLSGCTPKKEDPPSNNRELPKNKIEIRDVWARPVKQGMMGGAYLKIANGTNRADTLNRVSTKAAAVAEVHESYQEGGVSGMRPAGHLPVEANSILELTPGGYHIMLMQLNRELAVGDSITATLFFSHHDSLTVQIPVQQAGN